MDQRFPQWQGTHLLNRRIDIDECRYVVLLTQTYCFNVEKDLKFALRITKKPINWFVTKFKENKVRVEYATLFTKQELKRLGPTSIKTSQRIVARLLQTFYKKNTIVVCPKPYTKYIDQYKCITSDTFTELLYDTAIGGS